MRQGSLGMAEAWNSVAAERGPGLCETVVGGAGAPSGAGLDPEHRRPMAELATHPAQLLDALSQRPLGQASRQATAPGCPQEGLFSSTYVLTLRLCSEVAERF